MTWPFLRPIMAHRMEEYGKIMITFLPVDRPDTIRSYSRWRKDLQHELSSLYGAGKPSSLSLLMRALVACAGYSDRSSLLLSGGPKTAVDPRLSGRSAAQG